MLLQPCQEMRKLAQQRGVQLLLPQDVVVARSLDDDHGCCVVTLTVDCCSSTAPCIPEGGDSLQAGAYAAGDMLVLTH